MKRICCFLIAIIIISSLFSCSLDFKTNKRSTSFDSGIDMIKYLAGTWECDENKTFIAMRYKEEQYNDDIEAWVSVDMYSYPAKANWEKLFSDTSLFLVSYAALSDINYYSIDNGVIILSSLDYNRKYSSLMSFSNEDDINLDKKTVETSFLGNAIITITDEGKIVIDGKDVEISGNYTFVSSDPDWFFKNTEDLWKKAAQKEIKARRDAFDSLKQHYIDITAEYEQTNGNNNTAIEWIVDGFSYIKNTGLNAAMDTTDPTINNFYVALGYLSHFNDDTVGAILADYGWNAVEQKIFYHDPDKAEEYLYNFKHTFETELGKSLE